MIAAVIPVKDEERRLKKTIGTLLSIPLDIIIPVVNGSSDGSCSIINRVHSKRIQPLYFIESLGIDVPRAIGAKVALDLGATVTLFLDGDMDGNIANNLVDLIMAVFKKGADMVLTNCYPKGPQGYFAWIPKLAAAVLEARCRLNREISLEETIGAASPSHGPHAVSRRFLLSIPLREIAIPPVSLALAAREALQVCVGTEIAHDKLGSPWKDSVHADLIAETIIGDCIEAGHVYRGTKRERLLDTVEYLGYHPRRRWDLLDEFLAQS
ncbi:MAG: glycosyltransferase family 2 protein [Peptococcaceae bacterium]|nr:glycosyltransferase family 2 protein [Peptococcaceae bacterium]